MASKNFAVSTVATAPSPATSGTSLVVASGEGARFPTVPFQAIIWPSNATPTPANAEVVKVTARSTDTLTIVRAQESSVARTMIIGDRIAATHTAAMYDSVSDTILYAADPRFGAVGDDSTDNTTAIQAAINAANAAGGGIVMLGEGTFQSGPLTWYPRVRLVGVGIDVTILKFKAGTWTGRGLLEGENWATLTGGNTQAGVHNIGLENITLDGNSANTTGGSGTLVYGRSIYCNKVVFRNFDEDGWHSEWCTGEGSVDANDAMEAIFTDFKVHDCGGDGIRWDGPHDSLIRDGYTYQNGSSGVSVENGGLGVVVHTVHSWGNSQDYAFKVAATGVVLDTCTAEGAQNAQIQIGANDCAVLDSWCYAAGTITTPVGIEIVGSAAGYRIADTLMVGFTSGSFKRTSDGGLGLVDALVYQASGNAVVDSSGAASAFGTNTFALLIVNGGAAGGTLYSPTPASLGTTTVRGNALIGAGLVGTPQAVFQNSGWTNVHRVGVHYSGDILNLAANGQYTGASAFDLANTATRGIGMTVGPSAFAVQGISAGSNPRTPADILRSTWDGTNSKTTVPALAVGSSSTAGQFARASDAAGTLAYESISFSRGGTVLNPASGQNIMVWRAPFACTVTAVRGHFKGGTSVVYNARKNQASNLLSANRTMSTADAWDDGTTGGASLQNTSFAAGDDLEIMLVTITGSVTEAAIQVDYTRP